MALIKKRYFKKFGFQLKNSFFFLLFLIQIIIILLSSVFAVILFNSLYKWDKEEINSITDFVMKQVEEETFETMFVTIAVAHNQQILKLFSEKNRQNLYEEVTPLWNALKVHGFKQFGFYRSTSVGLQDFLLVPHPDVYGNHSVIQRSMVSKCHHEHKLEFGLEQDKLGYGFRTVAPAYYKGKYIGCIELGTEFDTNFFEKLNKSYKGKWAFVNLVLGTNLLTPDKNIINTLNMTEAQAKQDYLSIPNNILSDIKSGKAYHDKTFKTESANLYIPIKDYSGNVVSYIYHSYQTDYFLEIEELILTSLLISIISLIITTFFIFYIYRKVVIPINALIRETEKIKNFQLDEKIEISTNILEIKNLIDSTINMKLGLSSFKKYVPAQLVRQLIETNQEAKITGQRKNLTVLFSDIANFTNISETMNPHNLTAQLSIYLDELTKIILDHSGTVDKYIGDAIMAFWGAPLEVKNNAFLACQAAIKMQEKIHNLNMKWKEEGRPVFLTRIGINTGEVIVGNIGSEQRLSYTVIGDAVNLASRLEGLNKNYNTEIIISNNTYQQCKNEIEVRILDFTTVKGKSEIVTIYQLIAEKNTLSSADEDFYSNFTKSINYYRNREFDKAIELLNHLLQKNPDDYPTKIFLERCFKFIKNPPPENWQGELSH